MSIRNPLGSEPRPGNEFATLAGGCFWCLEAVYEELVGVFDVESGYSNGNSARTSYREVCNGDSGHAEVVRIEFDPKRIAFEDLLRVFFGIHDPTTPGRQGADIGTQYRSAIFHHSDDQKARAQAVMAEAAGAFDAPLVTELEPVRGYSRAEDCHQEYFRHHPDAGYCRAVVGPKVAKFRKLFATLRKG
jgi:peptide-methionine (S)-S-oxide reductase